MIPEANSAAKRMSESPGRAFTSLKLSFIASTAPAFPVMIITKVNIRKKAAAMPGMTRSIKPVITRRPANTEARRSGAIRAFAASRPVLTDVLPETTASRAMATVTPWAKMPMMDPRIPMSRAPPIGPLNEVAMVSGEDMPPPAPSIECIPPPTTSRVNTIAMTRAAMGGTKRAVFLLQRS